MYLPRNELSYHCLTTIYIQVLQSKQLELSLSRWGGMVFIRVENIIIPTIFFINSTPPGFAFISNVPSHS
jgi:hypothetical protein